MIKCMRTLSLTLNGLVVAGAGLSQGSVPYQLRRLLQQIYGELRERSLWVRGLSVSEQIHKTMAPQRPKVGSQVHWTLRPDRGFLQVPVPRLPSTLSVTVE